MIAVLAYALEPYTGVRMAIPAAWAVTIGGAAVAGGFVYLIVNGG